MTGYADKANAYGPSVVDFTGMMPGIGVCARARVYGAARVLELLLADVD